MNKPKEKSDHIENVFESYEDKTTLSVGKSMEFTYNSDGWARINDHKKKMERAKKILNERTSIEPKVIGECPFCGKYVSAWLNSLEEDGLFYCQSCHEPILCSATRRFTDDDMLRWCKEKPERIGKTKELI